MNEWNCKNKKKIFETDLEQKRVRNKRDFFFFFLKTVDYSKNNINSQGESF